MITTVLGTCHFTEAISRDYIKSGDLTNSIWHGPREVIVIEGQQCIQLRCTIDKMLSKDELAC
jgi:hypothetical protein